MKQAVGWSVVVTATAIIVVTLVARGVPRVGAGEDRLTQTLQDYLSRP